MISGGWLVAPVLNTRRAQDEVARLNQSPSTPDLVTYSFRYKERWGRAVKQGELFPRYLFIGGGWRSMIGRITECFYVLGILSMNNEPSVFPNAAFEQLRCREDRDGFIWLHDRSEFFKRNQMVRVVAGPFTGFNGVVKGMRDHDRVDVLLKFFNAPRKVTLPTGELVAA